MEQKLIARDRECSMLRDCMESDRSEFVIVYCLLAIVYCILFIGCKGSANRAKHQRKMDFSLHFRDAAYLRDIISNVRISEQNTKENAL